MKNQEAKKIEKLFKELCRQKEYNFPREGYTEILGTPSSPGVYITYSPRGTVLHVGRTPRAKNGLRQRINDHLLGNSSFVGKYLKGQKNLLRMGYRFKYLIVKNPRERALLEELSIGKLCPVHLGLG